MKLCVSPDFIVLVGKLKGDGHSRSGWSVSALALYSFRKKVDLCEAFLTFVRVIAVWKTSGSRWI